MCLSLDHSDVGYICTGLKKDRARRGKKRHAPKAVEAISLDFATDCNTSGYTLLIEGTGKIIISNQALSRAYQGRFDEDLNFDFYLYRKCQKLQHG